MDPHGGVTVLGAWSLMSTGGQEMTYSGLVFEGT